MRKTVAIIMIWTWIFLLPGNATLAQETALRVEAAGFPILINRVEYTPDMPVVTVNDYTYLPLRQLGEVLHKTVTWNGEKQQVEIMNGQIEEQNTATVPEEFEIDQVERETYPVIANGETLSIKQPVVSIAGFLYLPLKAVGDALQIPVYWNATLSRVEITLPPDPVPTEPVEGLTNLAYQKPAEASDSWNDSYYPNFAMDMDLSTRWASRKTDFMWICVDLEEPAVFDTVKLYDYQNRTQGYEILVSDDNVNFMQVADGETLCEQGTQIDFSPVKARYVRVAFTAEEPVSIYSFEVYNRSQQEEAPGIDGEQALPIETPQAPERTPRPEGIPAPTPDPARPDLIAYANPENGTEDFKVLNNEPGSTIAVVEDPEYGKVFQFHKNIGANRNEVQGLKGLTVEQGKTYYLGWRYKVDMPADLTTNALFQWKAYGFPEQVNPMLQNYPITLNPTDGRLGLTQFNPKTEENPETLCWDIPFVPNEWHDYVLAIYVSDDVEQGWISFYYDGELQVLNNGDTKFYCRTFDCDYVDPKWGIYGGKNTEITSWLTDLRVASTYESAAPAPKGE